MNAVLAAYAGLNGWHLVVVGDRKGPKGGIRDGRLTFLDIDGHDGLGFDFTRRCPENSYARKNIGYLYAASRGAEVIAETDDDNAPRDGWGEGAGFEAAEREIIDGTRFYNVYREFTEHPVWPRGFPLDEVICAGSTRRSRRGTDVGVWQFMADKHPDVDAIYRLTQNRSVFFRSREPFALAPHVYCPFNSQNTFWRRETYPFMYMPFSVTIRFTDILRGYVAQRLLWDQGMVLGFGPATVIQDRNVHDLMRDFKDEVPMYLQTRRTVDVLESLGTDGPPLERIQLAYAALLKAGIVTEAEIGGLEAWAADFRRMGWK